jgi:hypothetical protein
MESAIGYTHRDVEGILLTVCAKFKGGKLKWDELVSAANLGFLKGYNSYDAGMGADFETWVWIKALHEIQNEFRKLARLPETIDPLDFDVPKEIAAFEFNEWKETLSEDGRVAVNLLFGDYPKSMKKLLKFYGGETPDNIRNALRVYLTDNLGWGKKRTAECFQEIRTKLKEK